MNETKAETLVANVGDRDIANEIRHTIMSAKPMCWVLVIRDTNGNYGVWAMNDRQGRLSDDTVLELMELVEPISGRPEAAIVPEKPAEKERTESLAIGAKDKLQ